MRTIVAIVAMFAALVLGASPALAVGPLVGTGCQFSWNPVTTNADGSAPTGPITYELWRLQGVQTTAARPPDLTGITTTSVTPGCPVAGQFTVIVDAMENGLDSVDSVAFPYMVVIPNAPVGFAVDALGRATWPAVGTYTDNTAIAGPVSYELWVLPSTATVPSGPPTMTVTTTSATLAGPAGAYKAFIKTLTTPTPGGSISESAALASPFVVSSAPATPTNLNVR